MGITSQAVIWIHLHLWTFFHGPCWLQGGRRKPHCLDFRTPCISFFWFIIDNSAFLVDNRLIFINNSAYLAVKIPQPLPCHSPQHCCPSESKYLTKNINIIQLRPSLKYNTLSRPVQILLAIESLAPFKSNVVT